MCVCGVGQCGEQCCDTKKIYFKLLVLTLSLTTDGGGRGAKGDVTGACS